MQNITDPRSEADTISIDEAIAMMMFAHGGIDETNAHHAFRVARQKIQAHLAKRRGRDGLDVTTSSSEQLDYELVDSLIIEATNNGGANLFDLKA